MNDTTRSHPAVRVCVGEMDEEIDVEVAPLIREVWLAGIKTTMSCQDTFGGWVWIEFDTVEELQRLVTAVCPRHDVDPRLYNAIAWQSQDRQEWWEYELIPLDVFSEDMLEGATDAEQWAEASPEIVFCPSVRFPRAHLANVVAYMKVYNNEAV